MKLCFDWAVRGTERIFTGQYRWNEPGICLGLKLWVEIKCYSGPLRFKLAEFKA